MNSSSFLDDCSRFSESVLIIKSGDKGSSKGSEMPVNCLISPDNAFLYNPLTSLSTHLSREHLT